MTSHKFYPKKKMKKKRNVKAILFTDGGEKYNLLLKKNGNVTKLFLGRLLGLIKIFTSLKKLISFN